jgi:hypothetical protein
MSLIEWCAVKIVVACFKLGNLFARLRVWAKEKGI